MIILITNGRVYMNNTLIITIAELLNFMLYYDSSNLMPFKKMTIDNLTRPRCHVHDRRGRTTLLQGSCTGGYIYIRTQCTHRTRWCFPVKMTYYLLSYIKHWGRYKWICYSRVGSVLNAIRYTIRVTMPFCMTISLKTERGLRHCKQCPAPVLLTGLLWCMLHGR